MYLKNEDVKIGTIPDANGSDTPLRKMEFLTKKEMKDSSRLYGKVIVPPGCALAYHTHENEGEAYHILQGTGLYNDNGTKYEVHAGDTTFTSDGAGHAIENIIDRKTLVQIIIGPSVFLSLFLKFKFMKFWFHLIKRIDSIKSNFFQYLLRFHNPVSNTVRIMCIRSDRNNLSTHIMIKL